jgi:hypothetical protein
VLSGKGRQRPGDRAKNSEHKLVVDPDNLLAAFHHQKIHRMGCPYVIALLIQATIIINLRTANSDFHSELTNARINLYNTPKFESTDVEMKR